MVNFADVHDIGARLRTANALNPQTITAGSTADNTEQNGASVDRFGFDDIFRSAKVAVPYNASLSAGENVEIAFNVQHSDNGSTWADYNDKDGSTGFSQTLTTADDLSGTLENDFDLGGAKQYVRVQLTANFSSTATDDVDLGTVMVLGGGDTPQS